ncbi:hypothetical protein IVB40_13585 [Bradyrhizobium sp. 40]|uniref:hypothetical protein n=1 Tax=Bradyrhizobium sp. 40 TaxID=2782674 RepID=UPI0020002CCB|nr:hypothetical protein [Bradyrhizobium sp. 40]UPJ44975.1 hypothetical protein IVB40_13585 [Bradyrhizobium sp. 40]
MVQTPGADPSYHRALFAITEKLNRAHLNPESLTAAEFRDLLKELCMALGKSIDAGIDEIFRAAAGLTNRPDFKSEAAGIVADARKFTTFIAFEEETLRACGISEGVAYAIGANAAGLRNQLSDPVLDPDRTIATLRRLKDDVCAAARHAKDDLTFRERRHKLKVGAVATAGYSLSVANAVAIAKSAGAFVWFGTLSIVAGGAIATNAGRFKSPADRNPG